MFWFYRFYKPLIYAYLHLLLVKENFHRSKVMNWQIVFMGVGQHVPGLLSHAPANFVHRAWIDQTFPAPPVQSPSTLLPFLGHGLQPAAKPPGRSPQDSCGTLVNRNSSQPRRMTGSHWAVTVGVWMSGLVCETGNGRHRKWARRGGVEKSRARVTEGAARTETNPFFFHPRFNFGVKS